MNLPNVLAFGGGTNSTAVVVGMIERCEPIDVILFADTGGEKPHTYENVQIVSKWLVLKGYPPVVTVKSPTVNLEQDCIKRRALPSIAYGFKTCSQRFKAQPQTKYLNGIGLKEYTRIIGFDADEPQRAKPFPNVRYPLIEWDWGRDECVEAIKRAGLPQPGKSSCFFCPSMKRHEIIQLHKEYPELMGRALMMEANADLTMIKGLGRDFSWRDLLDWDEKQLNLFCDSRINVDCGCYDGD